MTLSGQTASSPADPRPGAAGRPEAMMTADGVPLKTSLRRAERRKKIRATLLVAPLLIFILVSFLIPILDMATRSFNNPEVITALPRTAEALAEWDGEDLPDDAVFEAMVLDMRESWADRSVGRAAARLNYEKAGMRTAVMGTARRADDLEPPYREAVLDAHRFWGETDTWRIIQSEAKPYTLSYYLAALDLTRNSEGDIVSVAETQQIYIDLFVRTLWLSLVITIITLALGFPVAYLLANLPARYGNLLMILVLLPFWTSLLVRTTAWIVMLQSQGVVNESLVQIGLIGDDGRLSLMHNQFGTIIAMSHILLPFMILPLYSVMKTIPASYVRAARSLGANNFTAFMKVYLPQTVPGIGAGAMLVFIISIGYYITPALVGGRSGQMISNIIAYHMQSSLNWGLAAALGSILLFGVLILYFLYNRLIGIDNMKLG